MKSVGFHPHEISGTGRSTDSRIGLVRGWGAGGNGESLLNGSRLCVWADENFLGMDSSTMLNARKLCT